jgi:hypothetical protein
VTNQNFYEVMAFNFAGTNVARGKPTTSFSAASFGPSQGPAFAAADGVVGESSYYNSNGISSAEFWQVNLTAPTAIQSILFCNRAAIIGTCWTPPASWTAAGIAGGCNTRAINQTLRVPQPHTDAHSDYLNHGYATRAAAAGRGHQRAHRQPRRRLLDGARRRLLGQHLREGRRRRQRPQPRGRQRGQLQHQRLAARQCDALCAVGGRREAGRQRRRRGGADGGQRRRRRHRRGGWRRRQQQQAGRQRGAARRQRRQRRGLQRNRSRRQGRHADGAGHCRHDDRGAKRRLCCGNARRRTQWR